MGGGVKKWEEGRVGRREFVRVGLQCVNSSVQMSKRHLELWRGCGWDVARGRGGLQARAAAGSSLKLLRQGLCLADAHTNRHTPAHARLSFWRSPASSTLGKDTVSSCRAGATMTRASQLLPHSSLAVSVCTPHVIPGPGSVVAWWRWGTHRAFAVGNLARRRARNNPPCAIPSTWSTDGCTSRQRAPPRRRFPRPWLP